MMLNKSPQKDLVDSGQDNEEFLYLTTLHLLERLEQV